MVRGLGLGFGVGFRVPASPYQCGENDKKGGGDDELVHGVAARVECESKT